MIYQNLFDRAKVPQVVHLVFEEAAKRALSDHLKPENESVNPKTERDNGCVNKLFHQLETCT